MRLNELKAPAGSHHRKKRVGRGEGSGHGKTSGKGNKGQRARSGGNIRPWFEGGQMPLQRRLPVRGFTNIFHKEYTIVNIEILSIFPDNTVVTPKLLKSVGIIKKEKYGVKILGEGELDKSLIVKAHCFSKSAEEKIKEAGGRAEVI
ncbi:MAG: large subunit ribosomal protein [Candidatus Poribacteria bacterium]|nr:large subunit ribosomal protein [Candidatus Poribacteria bacterium]